MRRLGELWSLLAALLSLARASADSDCPPGCLCMDQVICRLNGTSEAEAIPADLPASLVDLSLTHAGIRHLYAAHLAPYKWLKRLVIEKSALTSIGPRAFAGLPDLRQLSLRKNAQLKKVDRLAFGGLRTKALSLLLSDNAIADISPFAFFESRGFRSIDLEGNPVETLREGTFNGLYMADFIRLPHGIRRIEPDAFGNLTRVHVLSLPGYRGSLEPFTFRGLKRVKKILVTGAEIPAVQAQAFAGLQTVEQLHIRSSNISRLKRRSFGGMKNVGELFIEATDIGRLDKALFSHVSSDRLRLRACHLLCSCHNMWLLNRQGEHLPPDFLRDNYCRSPRSLADRSLADVPAVYVRNCHGRGAQPQPASSSASDDYAYDEADQPLPFASAADRPTRPLLPLLSVLVIAPLLF